MMINPATLCLVSCPECGGSAIEIEAILQKANPENARGKCFKGHEWRFIITAEEANAIMQSWDKP